MKRIVLAIVALGLSLGMAAAQSPDAGYCIERAIPYRSASPASAAANQACRVDIARPADNASLHPVIVWFHGGGLTGGAREIPRTLLQNGCVIVGAGYRLAPDATVSQIIDDAAAAVAWVMDHAVEYGGDPARIYLAGHSAGGYLIQMVGLDRRRLARYGHTPDSLAGVIPLSGQTITHFEQRRAQGLDPLQPLVDTLAPLYYVRADAPPMLLVTGDRERELFGRYEEVAYFRRMMLQRGHEEIPLYELDGFDHVGMLEPGLTLLNQYIEEREKP